MKGEIPPSPSGSAPDIVYREYHSSAFNYFGFSSARGKFGRSDKIPDVRHFPRQKYVLVHRQIFFSVVVAGLFLLNLVCRSRELRNEIFERLKTVFAGIVSMKTKEDVNEVVICWKQNARISKRHVEKATKTFFSCSKEQNLIVDEDILNITETMELVKV